MGRSSGLVISALQVAVQSISGVASPTPTASTLLLCNSSSAYTVTLPTAVGRSGVRLDFKNTGQKQLTIATTGGQTIDGQSTYGLAKLNAASFISDGSVWWII